MQHIQPQPCNFNQNPVPRPNSSFWSRFTSLFQCCYGQRSRQHNQLSSAHEVSPPASDIGLESYFKSCRRQQALLTSPPHNQATQTVFPPVQRDLQLENLQRRQALQARLNCLERGRQYFLNGPDGDGHGLDLHFSYNVVYIKSLDLQINDLQNQIAATQDFPTN